MTLRSLNMSVGQEVLIRGRSYRFTGEISRDGGLESARDLGFCDVRTHAPVNLNIEAFNELYASGDVRILRPYERKIDRPEPLDVRESDKVRWRRAWCEAYDQAACSKSDRALQVFIDTVRPSLEPCGEGSPSPGALRRWIRERGAPGDRRARFMGDRRTETGQALRIEPRAQAVLSEAAEAYYDGVRLNPQAVYASVRTRIAEMNNDRPPGADPIRPPSESTVRRYLRRHLDYGRAVRRYGWREGSRRFRPVRGSMSAAHILDVAIIDQTLIDCSVIDDEHLINVGRPWLAVMIDVHSRYPLGFCLSFEKPSVETVLATLRHALRPKGELSEVYSDIRGEWLGFGVPDTIVVDNAWENTGSSFRDACADANISIHCAPVGTPEYKGICERFFHTLNTMLFHRLPGGLPFTPQVRKRLGFDNERDAALLLSDVKRAIYQCIVEVYSRSFHKALQASPEQVWRRSAPLHGRPYVEDLAALDIALAKLAPSERTLTRSGVTLNDLTYSAPEVVGALLADLIPIQAPRGVRPGTARVKVKYHPEDLERVYVWNPVRKRYFVIPCTQPTFARGLSEYHHKLIRAFAREEHLAFQSEDERCAARTRLQNLILPSIPLNKVRGRQDAQRVKPRSHASVSTLSGSTEWYDLPVAVMNNRSDDGSPHRAPTSKRPSAPRQSRAQSVTIAGHLAEASVRTRLEAERAVTTSGTSNVFAEFFATDEGGELK